MRASVHPLQRSTATDQIYTQLRDRLMMGGFAPGEPIPVADTAEAFGVSAMPAREAIARLVAEGVLEAAPKKPATVPQLSLERFREIILLRSTLEPLALERAMAGFARALHEDLRALDAGMARAIADGDATAYLRANFEFHFRIYRAAGQPLLLDMIERLWLLVGPAAKWYDPNGLRIGSTLHGELIDAIERGDVDAGRRLLERDIRSGTRYLTEAGGLLATSGARSGT